MIKIFFYIISERCCLLHLSLWSIGNLLRGMKDPLSLFFSEGYLIVIAPFIEKKVILSPVIQHMWEDLFKGSLFSVPLAISTPGPMSQDLNYYDFTIQLYIWKDQPPPLYCGHSWPFTFPSTFLRNHKGIWIGIALIYRWNWEDWHIHNIEFTYSCPYIYVF